VIGPAVLAPLVVGGAALLLKRTGLLRRWVNAESESIRRAQALARAILGNDKHAVAAVLGLPEASSGAGSPQAMFLANTWYYRLDRRHCIAIAIEFSRDMASDVRVLLSHQMAPPTPEPRMYIRGFISRMLGHPNRQ
jgi:hypothetical protein